MHGFQSWTDRRVRSSLGHCLFSFVLMADTHVDRENHPSSSPFPINARSNARTRGCIADINGLREEMGPLAPRFALHLGDLIHPVPSMPAYAQAANDFHDIVAGLDIPLYVLPGNHDVGDKPVGWAPAGVVREAFLTQWEEHFGHQYQAFDHQEIHFILLNAQIINSGLKRESEQRAWLEMELKSHANRRIFLCLHYPPFLCFPDEGEHYDNLAEPGRTWILNLIETYRVEALFAGHVHHFWYHRFASTDCYLLPSTSFTRQDYSEMFRRPPTSGMHDGRNDTDKLGYFVVLVYEQGHVCHFRRTGKSTPKSHLVTVPKVVPVHPREAISCPVGFDMRHPWVERIDIAPSGTLDEFRRKRVRNDYPLLALWEMGVGRMRLPVEDLEDSVTVARMRALRESGHEFVVVSEGIPSHGTCDRMIQQQELVRRWEVTLPLPMAPELTAAIRAIRMEGGFPVYLSKLRMKSDLGRDGEPYFHQIQHGFTLADDNDLKTLRSNHHRERIFDGVVFRVARSDSVHESITNMSAVCKRLDLRASITMYLADPNPALHRCDDLDNVHHIAEGMFSCSGWDNAELFIDTFMDLDRGHSVRNGVIDRMCNPRPAMLVVRHLCAILATMPDHPHSENSGKTNNGRWISRQTGEMLHLLVLTDFPSSEIILHDLVVPTRIRACAEVVDLVAGVVRPIPFRVSAQGGVLTMEKGVSGVYFVTIPLPPES